METLVNPVLSSRDKKRKRQNKKLLLLLLITGVTATVLVATTYAWFVGIGTVKVNNFTVGISSDDALEISLDGYTWDDNITINETTIQNTTSGGQAYDNNTNKWVGEDGLVPVSSSGDNTLGKLDIFSKSSLTATGGGYRIIANKLDNASEEDDKYVTFDIFVKNNSGDTYTKTYNILDDEAIYLTNGTNGSKVTSSASGQSSYGVQNSVRVAFVQIGRTDITGASTSSTPVIACTASNDPDTDGYTSLCNATGNTYKTVIWEPNDTAHDSKLINYYNTVCRSKTATGTPLTITYGTLAPNASGEGSKCTTLTASTYVATQTVKKAIASSDNVDIYDGLNGYTDTIQADSDTVTKSLQTTTTFTDTMKDVSDTSREAIFKLAPHSITKIRVYIYLEGQDVDNYDLISNDQDIIVSFGFTKSQLDLENVAAGE